MDEGESRRHSPRRPALNPPGRGLYLLEWRGEPMAESGLVRAVAVERFGFGASGRCGVRFVEQVVLGKSGGFQLGVGFAEPEPLHALASALLLTRDIFWFGLYTGMRRGEILTLRWERVDMTARLFRVDETKTGEPLELPMTRQLPAIFERRRAEAGDLPDRLRTWVFPSPLSVSGHVEELQHLHARITKAGGAKFWFHALRNCFITVAERDLMLPRSLTKRLVNHARPSDVTEGYAADWTLEQLRDPAQRIADRIDELLMNARALAGGAMAPALGSRLRS